MVLEQDMQEDWSNNRGTAAEVQEDAVETEQMDDERQGRAMVQRKWETQR